MACDHGTLALSGGGDGQAPLVVDSQEDRLAVHAFLMADAAVGGASPPEARLLTVGCVRACIGQRSAGAVVPVLAGTLASATWAAAGTGPGW
jgi:hypothetical protein